MWVLEGDLIQAAKDGRFDVIVHGCNCFCTMGAGIARAMREHFPEAYEADLSTKKGAREKLGTISIAQIKRPPVSLYVVNAYTQFDWRGRGVKVDYDALRRCMVEVKTRFPGLRIAYPMIGAGLAGGDWTVIEKIIDDALAGENHTLVRLP
jgi:O-acetyl-ADP-ribose deacetylase (regulator of RNase III)